MPSDVMEKFEFGQNWKRYSQDISEDRILAAKRSLQALFATDSFTGKRFLDIGSGSGLFSLAAHLLGAKSIPLITMRIPWNARAR